MKHTILLYLLFISGLWCDIYAQSATTLEVAEDTTEKWILPDVGYLHLNHGGELFIGGGYKFIEKERLEITQKFFFVQTLGQTEEGKARYLQSRTEVRYRLNKIEWESVLLPYFPLNSHSKAQLLLERTKLEYKVKPMVKVGAGYGAWFDQDRWKHDWFATVTLSPHRHKQFGTLEFWLHPINGVRVQMSFELKKL